MAKSHPVTLRRLPREQSENNSGALLNSKAVKVLRERDYYVLDRDLDGAAPKELIKVYEHGSTPQMRRLRPKSWTAYIAKSAEKWYPHESVIEFFINRAGQVMGLPMNEVKLLRINGQVRFLSKIFLRRGETLIHGAEICGDFVSNRDLIAQIANDRKASRQLLTFRFVHDALHFVFPDHADRLLENLVRVLVFDALVGNNDRHFYNWGVIRPVRKKDGPPRLAPIYDSARGYYWNHSEASIVSVYHQLEHNANFKKYVKYLEGASPRFSLEVDKKVNHFDFVYHLCQRKNSYLSSAVQLANPNQEALVIQLLHAEFADLFSPQRIQLMQKVTHDRFARIRDILNHLQP